ncbi:AidA/PixA family protein [Kitasatospora sp. NPDC101447]|uniref:AidA/PixA family protein n=1 Tax=Kitasatospora sp. NPDC101447 TaxID=3364102 RepID=UPI0037FE22C0
MSLEHKVSTTSESPTRPKVIDILAVFDVAAILGKHENPSQNSDDPTEIESADIHPFSPRGGAVSEFGELVLEAAPGDYLRWRATALPFDDEYSVLIYRCFDGSGATSEFEHLLNLVLLPRLKGDPHEEGGFDTELATDQVSAMRLAATGNPFVRLDFEIIKGDEVVGYFSWNLGLIIPVPSP